MPLLGKGVIPLLVESKYDEIEDLQQKKTRHKLES